MAMESDLIIIIFYLTLLVIFGILGYLVIKFVQLLLKSPTSKDFAEDGKRFIDDTKQAGTNIYNALTASQESSILDVDDELFAIANNEIETSSQQEGLWVKCLILADGDKNKQKIKYIQLRVAELGNNLDNKI